MVYGGSSSSKTYSITQNSVIAGIREDTSTYVFRKESTTIKNSVYADFKKIARWLNEYGKEYEIQAWGIFGRRSKFCFSGLDDPEKVKGMAGFKRVFLNELSKFDEQDWDEVNRRLRGLPNQKIIADWNPIDENHWIKTNIIDREEWVDMPFFIEGRANSQLCDTSWKKINASGDTVLIKTSFRDNYWVVGSPCGSYGFVDVGTLKNFEDMRRHKPNQYQVYGLGEWGTFRVGGEFWKQFDIDRHVQPVAFLPDKAVHVSVDINVLPYISQSLWQVDSGRGTVGTGGTVQIRQFGECPARDPENTAVKAAQKVVNSLKHLGYAGIVHVYGDASGKNRSAIEKSTFFGKYFEELRKYFVVNDRVMKSNPSVAMSAAFINDIYEGLTQFSIVIGDNCPLSKQDYNTVKEDMEGGMLKEKVKDSVTGQAYEKNGHLSDAKRYFICKILEKEYKEFLVKRRKYNVA